MMRCRTLALTAAAALCTAAAPAAKAPPAKPAAKAPAVKAPPAKAPAAKPPAAKAPAAKPAAPRPAAAFSAQDPTSLVALLAGLDARAEVAGAPGETVFLKVTTPAYGFSAQFAGCDKQGRRCKAVAFTTLSDKRTATMAELNSFNQTSLTCRAWQDKAGKPHVMYSALVSPQDTREEMRTHLGAWQGCLANFGDFLTDPPGYLAAAP